MEQEDTLEPYPLSQLAGPKKIFGTKNLSSFRIY